MASIRCTVVPRMRSAGVAKWGSVEKGSGSRGMGSWEWVLADAYAERFSGSEDKLVCSLKLAMDMVGMVTDRLWIIQTDHSWTHFLNHMSLVWNCILSCPPIQTITWHIYPLKPTLPSPPSPIFLFSTLLHQAAPANYYIPSTTQWLIKATVSLLFFKPPDSSKHLHAILR